MSGLFDGTPLEQPVTCEQCGKPRKQCKCPKGPRNAAGQIANPQRQHPRVSRERRGGGKMITIISGLDPRATNLPNLLKEFKAKFGAGGTLTEDRIELQGDHRDKLVDLLRTRGYQAKPSGG